MRYRERGEKSGAALRSLRRDDWTEAGMFLREAETDHNFANGMEFIQSHHAANNEPFGGGPAATIVLGPGHQHHLHHPGLSFFFFYKWELLDFGGRF